MPAQVLLDLEALAAHATAMHLVVQRLLHVGLVVGKEVATPRPALREAPSALVTVIWLLARVDADVLLERPLGLEPLPTGGALARPLGI